MPDEGFRLPKSSYDELVKIIRAYGSAGKEVSLPQLKQATAMHETIISRNNAFLSAIGIIEGAKAKTTTAKGRELAMALQHNIPEQIGSNWRDIVLSNEFLQKMIGAVSIRQGMEFSALQSHIAYSAGEPKRPDVMAGAGAVIEILKLAGLLADEDGKLIAKEAISPAPSGSIRAVAKEGKEPAPPFVQERKGQLPIATISSSGVSIQIQIQCSANELADLAPKLRALLKELSKPEESEERTKN